MDELDDATLDALPKFGQNARSLILQALLKESAEEEQQQGGGTAPAAAAGPSEAERAALKAGAEYLAAVDPKERPQVAYIPKPKFARVVRQTVLNKLAGHHLALAGLGGEGGEGAEGEAEALAPGVMAADGALRRAAFATALAQELALYGRCNTGQVYQNLASRTSALDCDQSLVQYERRRKAPQRQQKQQQQPGERGEGAAPPPAKRRRRAAAQLQAADLDWEATGQQQQGEGSDSEPNSLSTGELPMVSATGTVGAAGEGQEGGSAQPAPPAPQPPAPPPTAMPALPLPRELALAAGLAGGGASQGGLAAKGVAAAEGAAGYQHSEAAGALPAAVEEPSGAGGSAPPGEAGAAPEDGINVGAQAAGGGSIREEVERLVERELESLIERGPLFDTLLAKCADKVCAAHLGAQSPDFLAREGPAVRKLVAKYVEHYQQR